MQAALQGCADESGSYSSMSQLLNNKQQTQHPQRSKEGVSVNENKPNLTCQ
jgi:cytochrome c1